MCIDHCDFQQIKAIPDRKPFIKIAIAGELLRQNRADQTGDIDVFQARYADMAEVYFDPLPAREKPT